MADALRQPLPIDDAVDLSGLGYDPGSEAVVILNPTRACLDAWAATFRLEAHEGESDEGLLARADEARFGLVPYMIERVHLVRGERAAVTIQIQSADDARTLENLDDRILQLAISELRARREARMIGASANFHAGRREQLERAAAQKKAGAAPAPGADRREDAE